MKCQKCSKAATMHITDVIYKESYQELHFCEECAQKYIQEETLEKEAIGASIEAGLPKLAEEEGESSSKVCDTCGMQFSVFRNTGRLGCPDDYSVFREELLPYLENIHGETKHCGKFPSRIGNNKNIQKEIDFLRKQLQASIQKEKYEEAAATRDKIKVLENQ